jgi:hypothetical protein
MVGDGAAHEPGGVGSGGDPGAAGAGQDRRTLLYGAGGVLTLTSFVQAETRVRLCVRTR